MHQAEEPSLPLFITGLPRSGTTLVRLLFNEHPEIAIPHETGIVGKCYDKRFMIRLLGFKASRYENLKNVLGEEVVQSFDSIPLSKRNTPQKVISGLLGQYAHSSQKSYWGEKTPLNYRYINFIRSLYPTATVLFIVRDPKAIFASRKRYLQEKRAGKDFWMTNDLKKVINEWKTAINHVLAHKHNLRIVEYEQLVSEPEAVLQTLFKEIGLSYYPQILNFYETAEEAIPVNQDGDLNPWHKPTQNPIDSTNIHKWKTELSENEIQQIDEATADLKRRILA